MKGFKNFFLLLSLLFFLSIPGFSQQYTMRDQDEIAYQAQLTLSIYKDLLNVISYEGLANESEIQELIRNSYSPSRSQIFYSEEAIVEDNVNPSNLVSQHEQDKTVKEYLQYFDLAYKKSNGETIHFYDFEVSDLKFSNYLYIKVKYTSLFKGKHKEDPTPYKAVDRLAEFRVEKQKNKWKTYITSIVYYKPGKPLNADDDALVLDDSAAGGDAFSQLAQKANKENSKELTESSKPEKFSRKKKEQDSLFNYHMEMGKSALAAEKLGEAFAAFSEAEKIYPFHQDLWQNLKELTKAQNLQIGSTEKRLEYAKLNAEKAYAARNYIEAKKYFSQALQLSPQDENLKVSIEKLERLIRAMALMESKFAAGEYKEAIKDYNKAIKKDRKNPDLYYGRGKSYEALNMVKEAFKDYTKAIELDGNFIEALSRRARLYTKTEQFHKAIADYSIILSNPDYAASFYPERASVKKIIGDIKGALEDYNAAIMWDPEVAEHHFEKGMILLSQERSREAINSFSEAIRKDPQYVAAFYHRGFAYAGLEELQAASADFERARALGLKDAQLAEINKLVFQYYQKAEGAIAEKRYSQALESFKEALSIAPDFGRAWLRAGDAYFMLQDYDNAILHYDKAVEHDSISFAYFKRGLAYQKKGDDLAADHDFKKYIPIGQEVLARTEKSSKGERSTASLQGYFVEDRAEASYALGYAQMMTNRFVEALQNLDMAIHIKKFFPKAYFARGSALYALEDYRRAVKNMEESIKMGLSDPLVFYALGKAYMATGKLQDAIFSLSHAIKLKPEYEEALIERAVCYKDVGQYGLALDDVKKAFGLNEALRTNVTILTHKGLLELHLNKVKEAKNSFDQALRLDGSDGWALYGKACVLAQEDRIEESLALYRKAFQTRQIDWATIKKDPLINPVSKQKAFKELVKSYF